MRAHLQVVIAASLGIGAGLLAHGCGGGGGGSGGSASTASGASVGSGLAVTATQPVAGDTDADPTASLFVTFDADVDVATTGSASFILQSDQGPVAAVTSVISPRVVEVRPLAALAPQTRHMLRVKTSVGSLAGGRLAQEYVLQFVTRLRRVSVPTSSGPPAAGTGGNPGAWVAGAYEVDYSPRAGVPLAGYGGGDRRHTPLPDLNPFNEFTFLNPSTGTRDPVHAKALVIGNGQRRVAILTLDAIATDADFVAAIHRKAAAQGFTVPLDDMMVCSSHSHSSFGGVTKRMFWELTAADLYVDRVFQEATDKAARALVEAERGIGPALIGIGTDTITTATHNRRDADSPDLQGDSIDPEMIVIRVDRPGGQPVATLWNIPIHGTHFGTSNMQFSADIMGSCSTKLEAQGAGIALFMNGAEGDIAPSGGYDQTGQLLADSALRARAAATTTTGGDLSTVSERIDLGTATLDVSVSRMGASGPNLSSHGFLQAIQNLGIGLGATLAIPRGWIETEFRFQAIRINRSVIASMPGEPIHEIGLLIKAEGRRQGYDHVIAAGLANGHGAYYTTAKEYGYGGYEALASLFGPTNGQKIIDGATAQMQKLKP